jgi:cell division protein FtsL
VSKVRLSKQELKLQNSSKKGFGTFLAFIAITVILSYAIYLLVTTQSEIAQKKAELREIQLQAQAVIAENERLERYTNEENRHEYIEQIARDILGYSFPDEKIYYIVPDGE